MRAIVIRIARKFNLSLEDAGKLVEAGLDTPARIKAAEAADVEKVIGKGKIEKRPA